MTHRIEPLSTYREWISTLAAWHFDYWGRLTGFGSLEAYVAALERWGAAGAIPTVLVAVEGDNSWAR